MSSKVRETHVLEPPVARKGKTSARNRQKLLDAAIEILLGDGMTKFTSTRIAEQAGLHKPAFYAQFKNVDECLEAVALHVARTNVHRALLEQTNMLEHLPAKLGSADEMAASRQRSQQLIEQLLQGVRQHETLYRLLRRYAHAEGALGDAVRQVNLFVFERWQEYFWRLAVHYGVDAKHFKEVSQMAEFVVAQTYIAIGRVVDGRATDLAEEATRVARYGFAIVNAEFTRMLAAPSETGHTDIAKRSTGWSK
jgi:AcrR family transcriptional regulator